MQWQTGIIKEEEFRVLLEQRERESPLSVELYIDWLTFHSRVLFRQARTEGQGHSSMRTLQCTRYDDFGSENKEVL